MRALISRKYGCTCALTTQSYAHNGIGCGRIAPMLSRLCHPPTKVKVGSRMFDVSEIQLMIPRLEDVIRKKDEDLRLQQDVLDLQQKRIVELDASVKLFKAECDKLRCVLAQKANLNCLSESHNEDDSAKMPSPRPKKVAVSAEPTTVLQKKVVLKHYSKSAGSKQLIRDAIEKNDFLRCMAKEQIIELVECMYEKRINKDQWIINEGEPGYRLFVVSDGRVRISKEGVTLSVLKPPVVIGELAMLYNCERTASVQAVTDVTLWVLERAVYKAITTRIGMERHSEMMAFLQKVSLLKPLDEDRISKVADALDQDYYPGSSYIVREGERGDTFFIINNGQVRVTQRVDGEEEPREIRVLSKGDYFGEKALLGEEVRTASVIAMDPGVEVLTLDRDSFNRLIGHLDSFTRDYIDGAPQIPLTRSNSLASGKLSKYGKENEFANLQLHQLQRLVTLGVGGFGRVDLVCVDGDESRTYALKAVGKQHVVDMRQQEHIFSERNIMVQAQSQFIIRMYRTFRDTRYVYMLLEACLGGELWTLLRTQKYFNDESARFYVACVVEAFDYLHQRHIAYRDLKPENCLLDERGYLKLIDLGFAKKLEKGRKTWTFCGTPEYVAPEIILNKGHDIAVDYWALGIYVCELVLGRPPFQASDPMKTYTLILKGIRGLDIPNKRVSKAAASLIKKLCRENPSDRIGSGSGGIADIRKHKWFSGFDWDGLRAGSVYPPVRPIVESPTDSSNFDVYSPEEEEAPEEFSGWDEGF
uniref:cGMP-dependent protein kinase n=1 Tax=Parascaris univalens TaxID=6257 RepID=A0A915C3B6_PARUN